MRKLLITLLIFVLFASHSYGAFQFDGVDDYITITDNAVLDIPDADWTAGGWVKLVSNAGTGKQLFVDNFAGGTTWWEIYANEASEGIDANEFQFDSADDDGTGVSVKTTTDPFASNTSWTHVLVVRSGNTVTNYINGTANGGTTNSLYNASSGGNWVMGRWADGSPTGYLNGHLAEWAKWDRALNADERAALAKGYSPNCFLANRTFYAPMLRAYIERQNGLMITNTGSAVSDHPRIINCY